MYIANESFSAPCFIIPLVQHKSQFENKSHGNPSNELCYMQHMSGFAEENHTAHS